ncbi:MAG: hypothetical protein IJI54_10735, partial [Kiritimatiellae bacterium]|nr:hypothetical protein [Kiritimatiellia bacterium]
GRAALRRGRMESRHLGGGTNWESRHLGGASTTRPPPPHFAKSGGARRPAEPPGRVTRPA